MPSLIADDKIYELVFKGNANEVMREMLRTEGCGTGSMIDAVYWYAQEHNLTEDQTLRLVSLYFFNYSQQMMKNMTEMMNTRATPSFMYLGEAPYAKANR